VLLAFLQIDKNTYTSVIVVITVRCPVLANPDNGMVTCSLGSDNTPTKGDICAYECDDGYVVSGNGHRECQSDGNWTGSEPSCAKCKLHIECTIICYLYLCLL